MIRSFLYVPASSERFIAKACERGADAVVLDLEDAVAPSEKGRARAALQTAVAQVGRNGAKVFVRINAGKDLLLADAEAACRAGAFGLFVPKTRSPETLRRLVDALLPVESENGRAETVFVPLLEDPGAVLDARAIAGGPRVLGLLGGGEDLATSMNAEPTPDVLHLPKLMIHMAAKAAGVMSFGMLRSVADYRDVEAVAASAREARRFGFDGATCVHPSIVPILNEAFAPSGEEIERAERMVAAAEAAIAAGTGAFVFDGKMVDEPIVARARALLARKRNGEHPT